MSNPIELPVDTEDYLYDPPLVDGIYFDKEKRGFAITFIPGDGASSQMTEFVFVADTAPDYPRVRTFWNRIEELLTAQNKIARIVHAGGGNYTFHFIDGSNVELSETSNRGKSIEIADRLKQIADAAQIAFLDLSYPAPIPPYLSF